MNAAGIYCGVIGVVAFLLFWVLFAFVNLAAWVIGWLWIIGWLN
jgi:hypothetical protein